MEDKIRARQELHGQLRDAKGNLFEAEQAYHRTRNIYYEVKTKYEAVDREIAMENKTIITRRAKTAELTLDQIKAIADRLGIAITDQKGDE